jgi:hypothetical protein
MNIQNLSTSELVALQQLINKALEEPQPVVKDLDYMIRDIMNNFDFDRVYEAMDALDWRWRGEIPSIEVLKDEAKRLLRGASKSRLGDFKDSHHDVPIINGCGGFEARAYCDEDKTKIVMLDLVFVVSSWDSSID